MRIKCEFDEVKCKASFDIDVDQETKNEFKKEKKYICLG